MIQRVQSLFLAAVLLCSILLYFTAIAAITASQQLYNFSIWGLVNESSNPKTEVLATMILWLLNSGILLLSAFILFQFKKRNLQIRMARLLVFLQALLLVAIFYYFDQSEKHLVSQAALNSLTQDQVHYALGALLPIISILFTLLSIYFIKKDEELVRSADRLR
jgi:predicted membrane protein